MILGVWNQEFSNFVVYHSSVAALYTVHSLTPARPKRQAQDQNCLWKMKTHRNGHTGNARPLCHMQASDIWFQAAVPLQSVASGMVERLEPGIF